LLDQKERKNQGCTIENLKLSRASAQA